VGPLDGMVVVDITQGAAGPFCTKLLAELGAEVIKVEPPDGDSARREGPFPPAGAHPEASAAFLFRNTGKRGVVADLATAEGRATLSRLVAGADVLVSDLSPGAERRLGLDLAALAAAHPALVLTHVTCYGRTGPYAEAPPAEIVVQALSGFLDLMGSADREPVMAPGNQAAHIGGLAAAVATLAALLDARHGGGGRDIDAAAVDAMLSLIFAPVMTYSYQRATRGRVGPRSVIYGPLTDIHPCRDGYITTAVQTSRQWEALCALLGRPDLLEAIPWGTAREHAGPLAEAIHAWLAPRTRLEAFTAMQEYRLPVGMVLSPEEVLADPQCAARGFFVAVDHPVAGTLRYSGSPFDPAEGFWRTARAPLLGEGPVPGGKDETGAVAGRASTHPSVRHPSPLPLAGLRVLDLTMVWAGPFAGQLLADLGAEVIKVEAVQRVDMIRWGGTADGAHGAARYNAGGSFHSLNRNKRGITLNLGAPAGREALLRLVERSDGLLENYSLRVMDNFGLGYETLHAVNPRLVMVSMPGYGAVGPYRDYVAFGEVLEGMAGMAALAGYPDGPPLRHGVAYLDLVGGYHGALALLAGLHERERTGRGRHIVLSQRDAAVRLIGDLILAAQLAPGGLHRTGNAHPAMAPHGIYPCAQEEWVAVAVDTDDAWRALCRVIGRPESADAEPYRTAAGRVAHRAATDALVAAWTRSRTAREAAAALLAAGVAAAPVNAVDTLFDDPYHRARGTFVAVEHPAVGRRTLLAAPFLLDGARPPVRLPAPDLGQHNEEILGALPGFDAARLRAMAEAAIIGREPL
jgi:crotonobetainyl-CoA:carnitine CoA-transferase CaiB-like acyl-CoA transferase